MLRMSKQTMRALALSGLLVLTSGWAKVSAQSGASVESDSAAVVAEFPLVLVYNGWMRFILGDYERAITVWQEYLDRREKDADTASVNAMMNEAWIRLHPLWLVYDGFYKQQANDIAGALASWERYIEIAGTPDTADVRRLIARTLVPEDELAKLEISVRSYLDHEFREVTRALSVRTDLAVSEDELRRVRNSKAVRASELRVVPQK
jgi:hypothetical protein